MDAAILDRIQAALTAGAATPTPTLTALLLEIGGEQCWRRARLLYRLTSILEAQRPVMASSTTHQFKPAFRGKDFSGFVIVQGDKTKVVKADNLTDEDVPLLQRNGGGHLIEPLHTKASAEADTHTVNTGILHTAVEQHDDTTIIKHSSGGPDDLPIEAPVADQAEAVTPEAKPVDEKPAAQPDPKPKKK